jgi:tetratricopeptide (TPR) repeat protein
MLGAYYAARTELGRASEVARDLFECARATRNPEAEFWANVYTGHVAYYVGEFRKAEHFMRAAAASDSVPAVLRSYALVRRGNALWFLGFPDQALALAIEGLRLGEDADSRYIYAVVLNWAGITHMLRGELSQAEDLFRKSFDLGTERGFTAIRAGNTVCIGIVSSMRGQAQAGLEQIYRGIELGSASSPQPREAYGYVLALALALGGRLDEAFSTLTPALEWAEQKSLVVDLAPMHHLKGRVLEGKSNSKEAENSFRTAVEIARRQSAKSVELGATTSLARLLAKQDRRDEARQMLAEIYGWFTEGFDTADLKDAKALLEELSNSP